MSRWRAFRRAMSGFATVVLGNQVHGVVVETVGPGAAGSSSRAWTGGSPPAPGVLLTVTVADCIPVYSSCRAGASRCSTPAGAAPPAGILAGAWSSCAR